MPEDTSPKQEKTKKSRPHLLGYLVILFSAAFLLLLMSYIRQQRQSDQQEVILQQNTSAMQSVHSLIEQNKLLSDENQTLRDQNDALTEQAKQTEDQHQQQEKTILALDYLWRIEREYFQGRYSSARNIIREMEAANLDRFLPEASPSAPDYRSPAEQYKSIHNSLF